MINSSANFPKKIHPELKIIADHLRSSCFLIADGVMPSNEGRGYVLRRIMRRGMRQAHKLGAKEPLMHRLVDELILQMSEAYPELIRARDSIISTLHGEEEKFRETLEKGLKLLDEEIVNLKNSAKPTIKTNSNYPQIKLSGTIAFKLYDTFGFPLDLTQDICAEHQLEIDLEEFKKEMEIQRQRARKNWVGSGEKSEEKLFFDLKEKFGATNALFHQTTICQAKILAIIVDGNEVESINSTTEGKNKFLILNQSCFYPTSGGQKGDDGIIIKLSDFKPNQDISFYKLSNYIKIEETKKIAGSLFIHQINECGGSFEIGESISAIANNRHRQLRAQNHSATHLLHKALKQVLGNSVAQKGSNVDFASLTFDFNHNRAMKEAEIEQVEQLVNFYIRQNSVVKTEEMDLETAKNSGAEMLFGEKYDEKVRVVAMGPSSELCGGTHVKQTGNIGAFVVVSENGIASGIRRIKAKSGFYALQHLKIKEQRLSALLQSLKIKPEFNDEINEPDLKNRKIGFDDFSYFKEEDDFEIVSNQQKQLLSENFLQANKIGNEILNRQKSLENEVLQLKKQLWNAEIACIKNKEISCKSQKISFSHHLFKNTESKDLREITNIIKSSEQFSQKQILALFAESSDKISLCLLISPDLTQNFDASKLIIPMIEKIGGKGGGGKKDLAMGGGNNKNGISEAIELLKSEIY